MGVEFGLYSGSVRSGSGPVRVQFGNLFGFGINSNLHSFEIMLILPKIDFSIVLCGIIYFIFDRKFDTTFDYLDRKFKKNPLISEINKTVIKAGYIFALPFSFR